MITFKSKVTNWSFLCGKKLLRENPNLQGIQGYKILGSIQAIYTSYLFYGVIFSNTTEQIPPDPNT